MNNKTKIMLGLSVLTAGTLAAGATGTLAWFTTNKTATATYKNIVAVGTQGNIKATISGVTDNAIATKTEGNNFEATGSASKMSDVSSKDGMKFAQPDWVSKAGSDFHSIKDVSTLPGYFTQYTITITNSAATENEQSDTSKLDLYLTGVEITTPGTTSIADWTRIAVIENVSGDNGFLAKTDNEPITHVYQKTVTASNQTYVEPQETAGKMDETVIKKDTGIKAATTTLADKVKIGTNVAKGGTKTVGVSVWVEGTLDNDQDTAKGQSVSVKLTFSAEASATK